MSEYTPAERQLYPTRCGGSGWRLAGHLCVLSPRHEGDHKDACGRTFEHSLAEVEDEHFFKALDAAIEANS